LKIGRPNVIRPGIGTGRDVMRAVIVAGVPEDAQDCLAHRQWQLAQITGKAAHACYVAGQEGRYDFYCPNLNAVTESDLTSAIYACAVQPGYFECLGYG